jgi:Fe-S cluster assembly protein SufD
MSQVAERHETWTAAFESLRREPDVGPEWLRDVRTAAYDRFVERGFPTTRDEEWRFTNVAPIATTAFSRTGEASAGRPDVGRFLLDDPGAHQIVLVNGRLARALSSEDVPAGLKVTSLRQAAGAEDVQPSVLDVVPSNLQGTPFVDLNTAFVEDALVIDVEPGAVVEAPVHVLHVTVADGTPVMTSPRLVIRAGERSQVSIIESYASVNDTEAFTNAVTRVVVAPGALVDHVKLQREPATTFHLATIAVEIERAGVFRSHAITLGGRLVRNDILSRLGGEGAECTLNGLYVVDGTSLADTHTTIDHAEPHCPSHEVYKGILSGRSRAVFNGKIIVRQKAQKTDAKQTNKALLLSDDAQVNTKPQLEIFADDVRCTHGATVGQLDEDQMFYLRARGVSAADARNMLIHAFAGDVVDGVRVDAVRELALRLVDDKLRLPHEEIVVT